MFDNSSVQAAKLLDVGEKLRRLPSSNDEILLLLEKAENILVTVCQGIPISKAGALDPLMEALIAEELFRHVDLNIQVAVASCLNQITRITAPLSPYPKDQMKGIFQLFIVSLRQLLTMSGRNFRRARMILKSLAEIQSCLMMLDVEVGSISMVVGMFQFFLSSIWYNHSDIFKHMETIMTLIINKGDEVSSELLAPLLDSVRKDMKEISPISWKLGKTIFEKCGPKLQPYLREAVKSLNLKFDDYAEIVDSIANGPNMTFIRSYEEEMVSVRIKIWWPLDKKFYEGTVKAFNHLTKKHKIKYDDDEEEILNLGEERWKRLKEQT